MRHLDIADTYMSFIFCKTISTKPYTLSDIRGSPPITPPQLQLPYLKL